MVTFIKWQNIDKHNNFKINTNHNVSDIKISFHINIGIIAKFYISQKLLETFGPSSNIFSNNFTIISHTYKKYREFSIRLY